MSDTTDREKEIFNQALELATPEARAAFLKGACGKDPELREKIEALLRAYAAAGGFLPTKDGERTVVTNAPLSEGPGARIGRYKLLQQIGEGGFGVVFMAEQEEPVRRRVALKVIKLGMDTKQVVARFEAERQALAMLDHPNIAKVFDAGCTEAPVAAGVPPGGTGVGFPMARDVSRQSPGGKMPPSPAGGTPAATLAAGRPYFVMELVRGIPITRYCDENRLTTAQRLDLFLKVCQAISHAHQKGIIHRDIKPSNILVTLHDGVPVPKVIDFGIAKATEGRLTDHTLFTAFEQFLGTPAYMSPEQAELSGLDIDTRSDIYSLGVLLYELLTGKTPFDAKELMALGIDAMRKTIREKEPPRPSTRLTQELVAAARAPSPPAAGGEGRGEEG
ncbi:MAG: serine/threonine protein kinase, partial [Chloroflexi bacterium]|nr:serine/threonine protein kinase [Chloroflexota bacterium]